MTELAVFGIQSGAQLGTGGASLAREAPGVVSGWQVEGWSPGRLDGLVLVKSQVLVGVLGVEMVV